MVRFGVCFESVHKREKFNTKLEEQSTNSLLFPSARWVKKSFSRHSLYVDPDFLKT